MKKYLRIWLRFIKMSWMLAMESRVDFFGWMLIDVGWATFDTIFLLSFSLFAGPIGNWTFEKAILVTGVFRLMNVFVWGWFYSAFSRISELLNSGGLDGFLVKPINSQFSISINRFSLNMVSSVIMASIIIVYGLIRMGRIDPINLLLFGLSFVIGIVLIYSLYFLTVSMSLFTQRLENIAAFFPNVFSGSRFPVDIYPGPIQKILVSIVPLALIVLLPTDALMSQLSIMGFINLCVVTVIFFMFSSWVWNRGLRRYASASS